jgi:hypothetical protein
MDGPLTPGRRALEIFQRLRDTAADLRAAVLAESCGGDDRLRSEVLALLAADSSPGPLTAPSADEIARWFRQPPAPDLAGAVVGSCRIVGRLGEGGMGRVYDAVQEPPGRPVAVKILRQSFPDAVALARFDAEARLLASIEHPGVCRIYEAGTWTSGDGERLPYFAMERIDHARSIRRHAEEEGLSLEARVRLVAEACDAVQAVHAKGVIHRDLKPGNLLVGRDGRPKVIDFGIARSVDGDGRERQRTGLLAGTPAYMSPEQLLGRTEDVDVRTDVHALGVILYELVTGRLPRDLGDGSLLAAVEALRSREPVPPERYVPDLPRDLCAVLRRAVEADPARRYASAADLGADLLRWLEHRPVLARPPSRGRDLLLWVRRHRALAGALAGLVLAIATGLTLTLLSARREREARTLADANRERAEAFLRRSREFIPWLLTDHERAVAGLPRGLPVAKDLALGVRRHLASLSYGEVDDPDLLLLAARSYVLLASIEGNPSIYGLGLRQEAREDALTGLRLAGRVSRMRPSSAGWALQAKAHLVVAGLDAGDRAFDASASHVRRAEAAHRLANEAEGGLDAAGDTELRAEILRSWGLLHEVRGELVPLLERTRELLDLVRSREAAGAPPKPDLRLESRFRMARALVRNGKEGRIGPLLDEMEAILPEEEAASGVLAAWALHYRRMVFLADAFIARGATSPLPFFERAQRALERWGAAAPGDREVAREGAALLRRRAHYVMEEGRPEAAVPLLVDSLAAAKRVLDVDPKDEVTWRNSLIASLTLAIAHRKTGPSEDSDLQAEQALSAAEGFAREIERRFPDGHEPATARTEVLSHRAELEVIGARAQSDPGARREGLEAAIALIERALVEHGDSERRGLVAEVAENRRRDLEQRIRALRAELPARPAAGSPAGGSAGGGG